MAAEGSHFERISKKNWNFFIFFVGKICEKTNFCSEETENWSLDNGPTIKKKIVHLFFLETLKSTVLSLKDH